jgi:hypothetical protein
MFFLPRRSFLLQTALGLAAASSLAQVLPLQAEDILIQSPPEGFKAIFDGKSFGGWHGCPHLDPRDFSKKSDDEKKAWNEDLAKHWKVTDGGVLYNDGEGSTPPPTLSMATSNC